jgi:hypothetical protein
MFKQGANMQAKIVWQQNSTKPENPNNLAFISQWWSSLANKEITFAQRLIPQNDEVDELNWEPQRFDEVFELKDPQVRGITLYWRKSDSQQERNTTPYQLVLDTRRQQLYIFPQSQNQLVIRVGLPEILYQTIEMKNPQLEYSPAGQNHILILRDPQQQLELKVTLSADNLSQLKQQLPQ